MKFKELVICLFSICLGIFTYNYIIDQAVIEAVRNSYWCVFGGGYVWFIMKGDSK